MPTPLILVSDSSSNKANSQHSWHEGGESDNAGTNKRAKLKRAMHLHRHVKGTLGVKLRCQW